MNQEFTSDIHICTCSNQHFLAIGSVCELCTGLVVDTAAEDKWPETPCEWWFNRVGQYPPGCGPNPFDELYFEELESFYDDIEYAA